MLKTPDADLVVWRDGDWLASAEVTIVPWQPSAAAGWGVFETLAVWDGIPLELDEHLSRFCNGILRLGGGTPSTCFDISDPIFTLRYLFRGGAATTCEKTLDANGDRRPDLSDAIYAIESIMVKLSARDCRSLATI